MNSFPGDGPRGGDVGIKLMVEVLDHYRGPDHKFRWLMAFAEGASDHTRTGWPSRELMARRIERSPARTSNIATELVADGVLKRDGGGGRHRGPTRFVLLPLALQGSPRPNSDTAVQGSANTNPEPAFSGFAQAELQGSPRPNSDNGHGSSSYNPQYPQPPAGAETAPTAQMILAAFIDWDRGTGGQLTKRTIGQLAKHIKHLLDEGVDDRHIRQGLADWRAKETHPATLDSFVNAAMTGRVTTRTLRRESTGDRAIAEAAALKAQLLNQRELA
jgi:hypothetical protein